MRFAEFLADNEEAFVGATETLRSEALLIEAPGVVFVLLDKIPVGDILHTVHADAVDMEVRQPALERRKHELPRWEKRLVVTGNRLITLHRSGIAKKRGAEAVAEVVVILAARVVGVRVGGSILRMQEEKVVAGHGEVRVVFRERHDDINQEAETMDVARADELCKVTVRDRKGKGSGKAEFEIGREIVRGAIAPLAVVSAIGGREEFKGVNTKFCEVRTAQACDVEVVEVFALSV